MTVDRLPKLTAHPYHDRARAPSSTRPLVAGREVSPAIAEFLAEKALATTVEELAEHRNRMRTDKDYRDEVRYRRAGGTDPQGPR